MRGLLFAVMLLFGAAQAVAQPAASDVQVVRDGSRWTADYRLAAKAPVWIFRKSVLPRESKQSWRIGTVEVLTPGVRLERLGHYDALASADGRPLPGRGSGRRP